MRPASFWKLLGTAILVATLPPMATDDDWWDETGVARGTVHFLTDLGASGEQNDATGLGLSLDLEYYGRPGLGLRASLGYFQLDSLRLDDRSPAMPRVSDINGVYLSLGPIARLTGTRVSPYVTAGAGAYLTDYDARVSFLVVSGGSFRVAINGGSLSLGLHGGAGLDIELGDGLELGVGFRITEVLSPGENLQLAGVQLAMGYRFD